MGPRPTSWLLRTEGLVAKAANEGAWEVLQVFSHIERMRCRCSASSACLTGSIVSRTRRSFLAVRGDLFSCRRWGGKALQMQHRIAHPAACSAKVARWWKFCSGTETLAEPL